MSVGIGTEVGPQNGNLVFHIRDLADLLAKNATSTYSSIIEKILLIIRVSGSLNDYGDESIELFKRNLKKKSASIEVLIPKSAWQTMETPELKEYFANLVLRAIDQISQKLYQKDKLFNQDLLKSEVEHATIEFLKMEHPNNPNKITLCQNCSKPLRTANAKQCLSCGRSW